MKLSRGFVYVTNGFSYARDVLSFVILVCREMCPARLFLIASIGATRSKFYRRSAGAWSYTKKSIALASSSSRIRPIITFFVFHREEKKNERKKERKEVKYIIHSSSVQITRDYLDSISDGVPRSVSKLYIGSMVDGVGHFTGAFPIALWLKRAYTGTGRV